MATAESPIRLALVDDHKMLLGALTEWIRGAASDISMVAAVTTWPELLTHPEFPVDVVLLDLDLKDNLPISLKISTLKTTGVKTVLMSTYSEPNVVREALGAGALGYLVKSEDAGMIVEAIRSAYKGESFISAELDLALNASDVGGAPKLSAQERRVMALYGGGERELWEAMKARTRESIAEGLPAGLPALHRAHRLQDRAAGVGFDWSDTEGPAQKVEEELAEVRELLPAAERERASAAPGETPEMAALESELGDLLFAVVNLCRRAGVHASLALDRANDKFVRRFEHVERLASDRGIVMGEADLATLDALWDEVKAAER